MNCEIDPIRLQRLVDGEMTEDERYVFLADVENHPEGWRRLALAYVEEQLLRAALASHEVVSTSGPRRRPTSRKKHLLRQTLALAASLVVAVSFGMGLGYQFHPPCETSATCHDDPNQASSPYASPATYQLEFQQHGEAVEVNLVPTWAPAVPSPPEPNQASPPPNIPPSVRQVLAGSGYCVHHQTRYCTVDLGDGQVLVIPINTVELRAHGQ
jgi:hypothetical protein